MGRIDREVATMGVLGSVAFIIGLLVIWVAGLYRMEAGGRKKRLREQAATVDVSHPEI
jgi:hypothetical protein